MGIIYISDFHISAPTGFAGSLVQSHFPLSVFFCYKDNSLYLQTLLVMLCIITHVLLSLATLAAPSYSAYREGALHIDLIKHF